MVWLTETWSAAWFWLSRLDQLLDGKSLVREPLLQPGPRQVHRRALAGQALGELRHEGAGQGQGGLRHVGHHDDEVRGVLLRHVLQALDPQVRQVAIVPGDHQPRGDPAQVFDQGQPEHDRNGPQLAQFQGRYGLVSRDEGAQRFGINLRIHMRNQFEHQVIDARQPGGRTRHEAGQFPAVTPGQMPAGHLDLLFDQVEIVEQPFGRVGDAPGLVHGLSRAVVGSENLLIFTQPREQSVGAPLRDDRVVFGEGFGVVDQLLEAEHLRAQAARSSEKVRACTYPVTRPSKASRPILFPDAAFTMKRLGRRVSEMGPMLCSYPNDSQKL